MKKKYKLKKKTKDIIITIALYLWIVILIITGYIDMNIDKTPLMNKIYIAHGLAACYLLSRAAVHYSKKVLPKDFIIPPKCPKCKKTKMSTWNYYFIQCPNCDYKIKRH